LLEPKSGEFGPLFSLFLYLLKPYFYMSWKCSLLSKASDLLILVAKICHFVIKKSPSQHDHGNFLEIFQKHCHNFKEKCYEIVKIFREFG
jgi:hypothetical protein